MGKTSAERMHALRARRAADPNFDKEEHDKGERLRLQGIRKKQQIEREKDPDKQRQYREKEKLRKRKQRAANKITPVVDNKRRDKRRRSTNKKKDRAIETLTTKVRLFSNENRRLKRKIDTLGSAAATNADDIGV